MNSLNDEIGSTMLGEEETRFTVTMSFQGRRKAPTTLPHSPDPYGLVSPPPCDGGGDEGTGTS